MFNDIGEKIKLISKILFWICIIVSVIIAVIYFSEAGSYDSSFYSEYTTIKNTYAFIGIAVLLVGPFISWILCLLMYGFGELIESAGEIAYSIKHLDKKLLDENNEAKSENGKTDKNTALQALLAKGIITKEEYEQKKK